MTGLLTDLRNAVRTLRRRPGFTLAAMASLALGVAANTAVFSVVNGLLFKDVPGVRASARLVQISRDVDGDWFDLSFPVAQHLRAQSGVLEELGVFAITPASVVDEGEPNVRGALAVTAGYLDVLGIQPLLGRPFTSDEASFPRVAPVVLIGHDLWQQQLRRDPDVVGRTIRVNGFALQVVGVLPPGFAGHQTGLMSDVFFPLGLSVPGAPDPDSLADPQSGVIEAIGLLQSGVTPAAAGVALSAAADRYAREHLSGYPVGTFTVRVDAWGPLPGTIRGAAAAFLAVLSTLVGLALAMACVNVSSMLLARTTERQREFALRRALGASPWRVGRQVVIESMLLLVAAGAIGTLLAAWATRLMGGFVPRLPLPGRVAFDFGLDWRVLAFALAVTVGASLLMSLGPALGAGRLPLVAGLRDGAGAAGARRTRLRSALVGLQVAATTILMVAAGLFANSLRDMRALDTGWESAHVHTVAVDVELRGAPETFGRRIFADVLDRVRSIDGVEAAAFAAKLPLAGCSTFGLLHVPGGPSDGASGVDACFNRVSPGYFDVLGLSLRAGRDFTASDTESAPLVAIINETLASRLFPGQSALGRQVSLGPVQRGPIVQIVGIVANAKYHRLNEPPRSFYYIPAAQRYNAQMVLHVRTDASRETAVVGAVRQAIRAADPYLPLASPQPLAQAMALFFLPQRIAAWVSGVMGVFALLLAAVGVYGLTAFMVSGRTREFGIRLALGATAGRVGWAVVRQGVVAPGVGLAIGTLAGVTFAAFARNVVSGLRVADPVAFGIMPLTIALVVVAGLVIPVARVMRRDPVAALRDE